MKMIIIMICIFSQKEVVSFRGFQGFQILIRYCFMIFVLLFYVSTTRFDRINLLAILEFHLSAAKKKNLTCHDLLKKKYYLVLSTVWCIVESTQHILFPLISLVEFLCHCTVKINRESLPVGLFVCTSRMNEDTNSTEQK